MNSSYKVLYGDLLAYRDKRDAAEDACNSFEYGSSLMEAVANVATDINSIPVIGKVAGIATGVVAAVSHNTKLAMDVSMTALGCDDIPFDDIKQVVENRFNEIERKSDKLPEAMAKVSSMVSQTLSIVESTRLQMKRGFDRVIKTIQNNVVKQKVTQIQNFVDFFISEMKLTKNLSKDDYLAKLEEGEDDGILYYFKESRTPTQDSLHTSMYEIIYNDLAIPKNANDKKAFQALYALFYGTQTYASVFGFLMESHSYLADHYYQLGEYEKFNDQVSTIKYVFDDFKHSLVGDNYGFVNKVSDILRRVKNKSFMKDVTEKMYKKVEERARLVDQLKSNLKKMNVPIITDTPAKPTLIFKPKLSTNFGKWQNGDTVQYAVQLEKNGEYSKLSEWSDSVTIENASSPTVNTAAVSGGRKKLIFRKFNDDAPQLVAIMEGSKTQVNDVNRDFYDAALNPDKDAGLDDGTKALQNGAQVHSIFEFGRTPLHAVCMSDSTIFLKLLTNFNVGNLNIRDRHGYAPLHVCAENRSAAVTAELIKQNADVNAATTKDGFTPLHIAVRNGYEDIVDELLKKNGIKLNGKDKHGFAPIHWAIQGGKPLLKSLLKRSDIDINIRSNVQLTPIHLAVMKDDYEFLEILKEHKNFDINILGPHLLTPLHFAAMLGNVEVIKRMIFIKGIQRNLGSNHNSWTPLHYAIFFKKEEAALELITSRAVNVNAKTFGDVTPLHMASATGQENIVRELIAHDADVNLKSFGGYSPLHIAAMKGDKNIVEKLCENNAMYSTKTHKRETALDLAKKYGRTDVVDYLESEFGDLYRKRSVHQPEKFENTYKTKQSTSILSNTFNPLLSFKKNDNFYIHPDKLLGQKYSSLPTERALTPNFDGSGTLLLLDVLLRKLTKEKPVYAMNNAVREREAKVHALNVTENFERLLSVLSGTPVEEQIDLYEVYSRVKKALMSGKEVTQVLCSYAQMLPSLKAENKELLMKKMATLSMDSTSMALLNEGLSSMITEVCVA